MMVKTMTPMIRYTIPESGGLQKTRVSLANSLGQEVDVLFDGFQQPGKYTVELDKNKFQSGWYILLLEVNGHRDTRTLALF
ncbi:MAG: hypothetical protein GXO82_04715 [Chlorobi bacterium]|nr:hypothetical protein [Chlorobiota bacterium]